MLVAALLPALLLLQEPQPELWTEKRVGSWVRVGRAQRGDVTLVGPGTASAIIIDSGEPSCVQQAARFLQKDIQRLTGKLLPIESLSNAKTAIHIRTMRGGPPEAYLIRSDETSIAIAGSDPRGTAFGVYELCERLGVDPLYHWTGYTPKKANPLIVKPIDHAAGPPLFKYRGLFHDDEDILPRPFDARNNVPYSRGTVPREWYEKYFETALRLRMNQVAPYVRSKRHKEIQKLASDWGLYYSSHHYDVLLSNPYGFNHFKLAEQRKAGDKYDWFSNREGILRYWKAGVEENKNLDAIYPVGLRSTDDAPYSWPANTTPQERNRIYSEAIRLQIQMTRDLLPKDKKPIFHFTMYGEMLDAYKRGELDVPEDVILVWDDNGDGIMRGLPDQLGKWKHGVYYHLAFFGPTAKQSVHTVQPSRIEQEFRKIVDAGATEYCLVNVSELREHVMETRFLADIMWSGKEAFAKPDAAQRFVDWWSSEYFNGPRTVKAYAAYYELIKNHYDIWYGSVRVREYLVQIMKKLNGEAFDMPKDVDELLERKKTYEALGPSVAMATLGLTHEQVRFFIDHVMLGIAIDYQPVRSAAILAEALAARDVSETKRLIREAMEPLRQMEAIIAAAERPPFQGWYRPTWIRSPDFFNGWSDMNVHRPYEMLRRFIEGMDGK
jgi:hypothetical protein